MLKDLRGVEAGETLLGVQTGETLFGGYPLKQFVDAEGIDELLDEVVESFEVLEILHGPGLSDPGLSPAQSERIVDPGPVMGEESEEIIALGIGYLIEENNNHSIDRASEAHMATAKRLGLQPTAVILTQKNRGLLGYGENKAQVRRSGHSAIVERGVLPAVTDQLDQVTRAKAAGWPLEFEQSDIGQQRPQTTHDASLVIVAFGALAAKQQEIDGARSQGENFLDDDVPIGGLSLLDQAGVGIVPEGFQGRLRTRPL